MRETPRPYMGGNTLMAQHGASGKHSANSTSSDKSSQETKKIDTAKTAASSAPTEKIKSVSADETKEMPKVAASKSAGKSTVDSKAAASRSNAASDQRTVKPVTTGAAEADAAQSKKKGAIIAAVVAIVVIIAAIVVFMFMNSNQGTQAPSDDMDIVDVEAAPVENPIDFAAWQAKNPDVYAYMNIPNTNVDLPILFSAEEDNYYLVHDIDHNYTIVGAIYSQSMNKQDFTDPVTVLYGHTLLNGTMFSELHKFEQPEFFEANPYFNVYLPDEILTYEVVSAFEYDNRHIMNTFDFSNPDQVQEFFDTVQAPDSSNVQVRNLEQPLKAGEDSILVLSTCTIPSNDNARFLVVGRLVTTQPATPMQAAPAEDAASSDEAAQGEATE